MGTAAQYKPAGQVTRELHRAPNDFDGDGRSDYGVYDAALGIWHLRLSRDGDVTEILGSTGTVPIGGVLP